MRTPIQRRRRPQHVLQLKQGSFSRSGSAIEDAPRSSDVPVPVSLWPVVVVSPTSTSEGSLTDEADEEEDSNAPASLGLPSYHSRNPKRSSLVSTYTQASYYGTHEEQVLWSPSSPDSASDLADSVTMPVKPLKSIKAPSSKARRRKVKQSSSSKPRRRWESPPSTPQSYSFSSPAHSSPHHSGRRISHQNSSPSLASPTLVGQDWRYQVCLSLFICFVMYPLMQSLLGCSEPSQ